MVGNNYSLDTIHHYTKTMHNFLSLIYLKSMFWILVGNRSTHSKSYTDTGRTCKFDIYDLNYL